jgi:hypothetical protein
VILICGIGWTVGERKQCTNERFPLNGTGGGGAIEQPGKEIFSFSFKNFGRLDPASRMAAYAVALALGDAGIEYSQGRKLDMGIIGTNASGSLDSDVRYFRDYLETGRTISRGNLFIYTLPTSPLGEAAVHFGLQGPLFYMTGPGNPLEMIMEAAEEIMTFDKTPAMLVAIFEEDAAVCFVLMEDGKCSGRRYLYDIGQAGQLTGERPDIMEIIEKVSKLKERKCPK